MTVPTAPPPARWPLALAVGVLWGWTAGLGLASPGFGYALDDAWIHLTLARNLAEHGSWGINPGLFESASSSLLWPLLLAASWSMPIAHEWLPLLWNLLFATLAVGVADAIGRDGAHPDRLRAATLLAVVGATSLPALCWVGMEHGLQVFTTLALVWVAGRQLQTPSAGRSVGLALLGALTVATRYEGLALVVGVAGVLAWRRQRRGAAGLVGVSLLPVLVFATWSMSQGGLPLPNSVVVKSRMPTALALGALEPLVQIPYYVLRTPSIFVGLFLVAMLEARRREGANTLPHTLRFGLFAWAALVCVHAQLAQFGWFFRYEAYLVALGLLVFARVVHEDPDALGVSGGGDRAMRAFAVAAALVILGRAAWISAKVPSAVQNIRQQQGTTARFLDTHFAGQTVAINDIGFVAWAADVQIVDLWGLADLTIARGVLDDSLTPARVRAYAESRGASVVVVYADTFGTDWGTPIGSFRVSDNVVLFDDEVAIFALDDPAPVRRAWAEFSRTLPASIEVSEAATP